MVEIDVHYDTELRCRAEHGPSHTRLATDAPVDNQGRGESFSPTDLLATSLGTCMLTTMGIVARRKGWNVDGLDARVHKHMSREPPRRVARLPVQIRAPQAVGRALDAAARAELEQAARTCPVALSLNPSIEITITVDWG
ncbi:MAG: OsmC family protein [Polyangiales bacterium]